MGSNPIVCIKNMGIEVLKLILFIFIMGVGVRKLSIRLGFWETNYILPISLIPPTLIYFGVSFPAQLEMVSYVCAIAFGIMVSYNITVIITKRFKLSAIKNEAFDAFLIIVVIITLSLCFLVHWCFK